MTKPPVLTEILASVEYCTGESRLPSVGAPLQEKADGRPYQDTKLGALEFMSRIINVNSVQNSFYLVP